MHRADGGSSTARRLKPNVKQGSNQQHGVDALSHSYDLPAEDLSDRSQDLSALLDFEQYFPSTLPLSMHHPLDEEADRQADAEIMRRGLPEELALKPVRNTCTAAAACARCCSYKLAGITPGYLHTTVW